MVVMCQKSAKSLRNSFSHNSRNRHYYYDRFTNEEAEAQRGCYMPMFLSHKPEESEFEPWSL